MWLGDVLTESLGLKPRYVSYRLSTAPTRTSLPDKLKLGRSLFTEKLGSSAESEYNHLCIKSVIQYNSTTAALAHVFVVDLNSPSQRSFNKTRVVAKVYDPLALTPCLSSVPDSGDGNQVTNAVLQRERDFEHSACLRADAAFVNEVAIYNRYEEGWREPRGYLKDRVIPNLCDQALCKIQPEIEGGMARWVPAIILENMTGSSMNDISPTKLSEKTRKAVMMAVVCAEHELFTYGIEYAGLGPCDIIMGRYNHVYIVGFSQATLRDKKTEKSGDSSVRYRWHEWHYPDKCDIFHDWIGGPRVWKKWMDEKFGQSNEESLHFETWVAPIEAEAREYGIEVEDLLAKYNRHNGAGS